MALERVEDPARLLAAGPDCLSDRATAPSAALHPRLDEKTGPTGRSRATLEDVPNPLESCYFFLAPFFLAAFFLAGIRKSPPLTLDLLPVSARGRIAAGPDQALNLIHENRQVERLPQVPVHLEALGLGLHLRRLVRRHEDDLRLHGGLAEPLDQLDPALLREAAIRYPASLRTLETVRTSSCSSSTMRTDIGNPHLP